MERIEKQNQSSIEELVESIVSRLRQDCKDSAKIDYWYKNPKKSIMLHEYFYYDKLTKEKADKIKDRVKVCIENFLDSETLNILLTSKINIVEIDEEGFPYIEYKGYKLYAKLDLLYEDLSTGKYFIVDWKTGKESVDDRLQMMVYALYVTEKYDVLIERIVGVNEYLLDFNRKEYHFTSSELDQLKEVILFNITEMEKYMKDTEINEPLSIEKFQANPCTNCRNCNFLKLCGEGKEAVGL